MKETEIPPPMFIPHQTDEEIEAQLEAEADAETDRLFGVRRWTTNRVMLRLVRPCVMPRCAREGVVDRKRRDGSTVWRCIECQESVDRGVRAMRLMTWEGTPPEVARQWVDGDPGVIEAREEASRGYLPFSPKKKGPR